MAFSFEKLIVYQKAVDFADKMASLTEEFPRGYRYLADQLMLHDIRPSRITVEIVEHAAGPSNEALVGPAAALRRLGVRIAVDDVGLGQSNCGRMLDCEPHYVKIARDFVAGCHDDFRRQAVLESIVRLADNLGAQVVAEGVERSEDLEALTQLGISLVQGFYFMRAVPSRELVIDGSWCPKLREGLQGFSGTAERGAV